METHGSVHDTHASLVETHTGHHRALGIVMYGPRGGAFLMSEVPLQ